MKSILLIGGAGFIGSNIIRILQIEESDYNIHVIEPTFANVSRIEGYNVTLHRGMLFDTDFIKQILTNHHIEVVVHLVSTLIPGSSYIDYEEEYKNVIFPSIRLMQLCCTLNIKFIYFSSGGTIYGNRSDTKPFKEDDPVLPISYYGWSKQMMENSILFIHRTLGLKYLILRPSNPYGFGQNLYGNQGFIAVCIGKIIEGKNIEVWGSGHGLRDYIFIDDLCYIFKSLLEKDIIDKTFNIGSGLGCSNLDVLQIIEGVVEKKLNVTYLPARNVDVSNMILDNSRVLSYIGKFEFVGLKNGISYFYNSVMNKIKNG